MNKLNTEDIVVLILTITIGCFVLSLVVHTFINKEPMSESRTKILNNLLMSFVNIISMYIGFKIGKTKRQ